MRTLWCTLILGWRNLGFAFPERDANPMVYIRSGSAKRKFCVPERDANPMVHTHSGLAKLKFCVPRTRCEPYGAHSFWVGETYVLRSQNEIRSLWCKLVLAWRNLGFAFPERDANPMVHTHSGLAKPSFCVPRTGCEPMVHIILGWRNKSFAFPERVANPIVHTHSGLTNPRFCVPRTRCEPNGAHSFWAGET